MGMATWLEALATDPSATPQLHVVSRADGSVRSVRMPDPGWIVHFGCAFEEADGTLVVDACVLSAFPFGEEFGYRGPHLPLDPTLPEIRGPQRLLRYRIAPGAEEATLEVLCDYGVDFPRFHPDHEGLPTPALYGATQADTRYSDPFDSIIRVDLEDRTRPPSVWTTQTNTFVGEPVMVPDPSGASEGWLLALVSDGLNARTTLVILPASDPAAGPIAQVPMPLLPMAFHGDWDIQAPA
jgi:carotenoid cleavage dioxygenase-like enzyme